MGFLGFINKSDEKYDDSLAAENIPQPPRQESVPGPTSDPFAAPEGPFQAPTSAPSHETIPTPTLTEEELRSVEEQPDLDEEPTTFISESDMNPEPPSSPPAEMGLPPTYHQPMAGIIDDNELPFTAEQTPVAPAEGMENPTPEIFEGDLSLPDLPDLLEETIEDSRESMTQPVDEDIVWSQEPEEFKPAPEPFEEELVPPLLEEDAPYLTEPEKVVTEKYVDSVVFYSSLQEIKAMKKVLRDFDAGLKNVTELDNHIDKQTNEVLSSIDQLQEELIKIDTILFEG